MENGNNIHQVWDPFERNIQADSSDIFKANQKVEKKIVHYQSYPSEPRRNMTVAIIVAVVFFCLIMKWAIAEDDAPNGMKIAVWLMAIPASYYSIIAATQSDWIGLSLAKKFKWLFKAGGEDLPVTTAICPQITITERSGGATYTQYWGALTSISDSIPFWFGLLSGPILFPDGSDKLQTFIVKLPRTVACDLAISPRMIDNALTKKSSLKTESPDFEKHFYIEDEESIVGNNVFQVLTPPVLGAINDLRVVAGRFRLIIYAGKAIFIFQKEFFKPRYTSLFKSTSLNPRDLEEFSAKLEKLTDLIIKVVSQVN